jgi:hypothetical protein
MFSRSAAPTASTTTTAERRGSPCDRPGRGGGTVRDRVSCRPLSALAYATRCHVGRRRESDGAPFVEHLSEVARLLRNVGCADVVVAAGLLHSVRQDTKSPPTSRPPSLAALLDVAPPRHRLVVRLAADLAGCPISDRRANHVAATPCPAPHFARNPLAAPLRE